jgi:uncharacterized protein (DUF433 family)
VSEQEDFDLKRISVDPAIMVGNPVVAGTRFPVERVLRHLEENDRDDLFAAVPELTEEDVRACLVYARTALERGRGEPAITARRTCGLGSKTHPLHGFSS